DRRDQNKGIGWDLVHVCVDDAPRLAYTEVLPDEKKESACAFLTRALAFFARHGVSVARVMTDNGSAHRHAPFPARDAVSVERVMTDNVSAYRSRAFRDLCAGSRLRHIRTRPYTPRTN